MTILLKNHHLICTLLLCTFWAYPSQLKSQSLVNKANHVYHQHRPQKALELYQQVLKSDASKQDKTLAVRYLAYIEGHLFKNIEQARKWTQQGLTYQYNETSLYRNLAGLEVENRQYKAAKVAANLALKKSQSKRDPILAKSALCNIILNEQHQKLQDKQSLNLEEIKIAQKTITEVIKANPTNSNTYKIQLGLALLAQDGVTLYRAWRGFFLLGKNDAPYKVMQAGHDLVEKVCKQWKSGVLKGKQAQQLFLGLFKSRFFKNAYIAQLLFPIENKWITSEVKEALVYIDFIQKAQKATYDFYLKMAKSREGKKPKSATLLKLIIPLAKKLWSELVWEKKPKNFDIEVLRTVLEQKFGAQYALGNTNGFPAFYGGHSVLDQTKSINQYGKKGAIRFMSLDAIVANDYTGWYRKTIRVGGWANQNKFVQLRPAYASGGARQWNILTDEVARKKYLDNMRNQLKEEDAIAQKNPYAYLPGVSAQVKYQELQKMYNALKSNLGSQDNLQLKFITFMKRLIEATSIYIHEGRHVIDKNLNKKFTGTELEYRAKLSEIALSPYPKYIFMRQIMVHSIGAKSSHGQANLMLIKKLIMWMEQNQANIKGFDAQRPTMPQFNKLTDVQLKKALQSLDPLAKSNN